MLSHVRHFVTPWTAALQASLSITNSWSLPKLMSIRPVMPSNHLILCHPLLLPSIFPSIRVFSSESALPMRWLKYWSFSFSISPSNEYSGLTSLRMDWLDLLAVQETLKSLLQPHRSKASILWCSAFLWSNSHTCTWLLEKAWLWLCGPLLAKWYLCFLIHCLGVSYLFFQWASFFYFHGCSHHPHSVTVILEPKKRESVNFHFPLLFAMKWWDWMPWS